MPKKKCVSSPEKCTLDNLIYRVWTGIKRAPPALPSKLSITTQNNRTENNNNNKNINNDNSKKINNFGIHFVFLSNIYFCCISS